MTIDARIRSIYDAFNDRRIDELLEQMTPDVDWPNAWEGGRLRGRDAVKEYWTRQFEAIDSKVEPLGTRIREDGRVAVTVHLQPADQQVCHVYTFDQSGLVSRMDVE